MVFIINAGAAVTISEVTIEHGSSLLGGGIFNAGTLTLTDSVVTKNTVGTQLGGGIFNSGTLSLFYSTVSGNQAALSGEHGKGGGIYNYSQGTLTLTNSAVSGNTAGNSQLGSDGVGGGIYNDGTLTLTNSTVSGNTAVGPAEGYTGGINSFGTLKLVGSTVSGNQADDGSGGIFANGPSLSLINSTVSGNSCGSADKPFCVRGAGGISWEGFSSGGLMTMSFTTVSGNSCLDKNAACPGGISAQAGQSTTVAVKNTILANNSTNNSQGGGNCLTPYYDQFASGGYNLSDDATCAGFLTQTGDLNNTPAGLDPGGLKNNGGPTQTIALLATSPAVNAIPAGACTDASGNPVTTDQRGVHRPQGSGCEIGAFEYFQSRYVDQAVQTLLLIDAVQSSPLPRIVQVVLNAPLQAAVYSLNQGNVRAAAGQLGAFVILVNVRGLAGGLSQEEADAWTGSATAIIQSLGN